MKSIYLPFFTLITLSILHLSPVVAQDTRLEFGCKIGLNLSSLSIDNRGIPDNRIKPGINLGFTGNYNFNKNLFLQTALTLSTKGARIKGEAPLGFPEWALVAGNTEPVLKSNQIYLQIPLQIGYNVSINSKTRLIFNAGPYLAYGIAGKTQLSADILYGDMIDNTPVEEKTFSNRGLQKFDYGLAAGIGIDLGEVILQLNYELGLKNIGPINPTYFPFYENKYKNRNLSLSLAFKF